MTSDPIDRVFGRGRLKMVTGEHVEVFREAAAPGESRRYTKRFLTTEAGDYAQWTEREWRILARLIGHGTRCVPDVVQYDRDVRGTKLVQTYDAGATVDQWATLLPVQRDGRHYARAFDDCAHWWALAHHCLVALDEIHTLQLVHLDVKGDNICIPIGPPDFHPASAQLMFPVFSKLALIDFAFSLVSGESLTTPLPIGWQQDYDYQSPRLLHALVAGRAGDLQPTEDLDWRCDMYSLAAMLKRYLPPEHRLYDPEFASSWTLERHDAAKSLILHIRETHDRDLTSCRPHGELIARTSEHLGATDLAQSLERGWTLAREAQSAAAPVLPLTPITRLAPPIRIMIPARDDHAGTRRQADADGRSSTLVRADKPHSKLPLLAAAAGVAMVVGIVSLLADSDAVVRHAAQQVVDGSRRMGEALREWVKTGARPGNDASPVPEAEPRSTPPDIAIAKSDHADEVAAGPISAEEAANDATSDGGAGAPSSELNARGTEGPPVPSQLQSPEALPPRQPSLPSVLTTPSARPSSTASSQSLPTGSSLASQIEAYRSKPTQRSRPLAGAPLPSTLSSGRAQYVGPADATRRRHVVRTNKETRAATSAAAVTPRATTIASKRASGVPLAVSSRVLAAANPARSVQSTELTAKAHAGAASTPRDIASAAGVTGQVATTPSPTAPPVVVVTAPSQSAADVRVTAAPSSTVGAATFPIAPPVEPPRAVNLPNTVASTLRRAPIVDASPTVAIPVPPPPRDPPLAPELEPTRNRPAQVEIRDEADFLEQAQWTLTSVVPRMSARVQPHIARVLWVAANAHLPAHERAVMDAATSARFAADAASVAREIAPRDARRLNYEAQRAYSSRRNVPEAFDLQLKAFGANPTDPEIAGNLAFLHLQVVPAQPERARQLAVYAIGVRNAQYPAGRMEDWTTFAIASALTGRQVEARHALFASLALSRNLDRSCRNALGALATFGSRLRDPVEALFVRLHAQGRDGDSPYCVWPRNDFAGSRYP